MDDFVVRALAAALGVALVSGPLGCFIVWRRMAYFGATLAHAALLGVALGVLLDVNFNLGILAVCVTVSALLVGLQGDKRLATDTLLGILAHGALALGLVVLSFAEGLRIDLLAYLFGDVLAVTGGDLVWVYGGGAVVLGALAAIWRRLLFVTVHAELARVSGVPSAPVRLVFMVLIAAVTAVAMKIVGVPLDRLHAHHPGGGGAPLRGDAGADGGAGGGARLRRRGRWHRGVRALGYPRRAVDRQRRGDPVFRLPVGAAARRPPGVAPRISPQASLYFRLDVI